MQAQAVLASVLACAHSHSCPPNTGHPTLICLAFLGDSACIWVLAFLPLMSHWESICGLAGRSGLFFLLQTSGA